MITEVYRFRYSDLSDLAIGLDDQGQLWFQSWAPSASGERALRPLGWNAYQPHAGLEEAEELLRLKAELDRLKAIPRPEPLPEVVREVVAELREKEAEGFLRHGVLANRLESAVPAPPPAAVDVAAVREVVALLLARSRDPVGHLGFVTFCKEAAGYLDAALGGAGEAAKGEVPISDAWPAPVEAIVGDKGRPYLARRSGRRLDYNELRRVARAWNSLIDEAANSAPGFETHRAVPEPPGQPVKPPRVGPGDHVSPFAGVDVAEVREVARLLVEGLPDEESLSLTEMSNRLTAALAAAEKEGR